MFVLTVLVSAVVAGAMAASAVRKARGTKDSLMLRDRLAVAPRLWTAIGFLEAAAVVGLLAGLVLAPLGVAAAVGAALLMAGAVAAHLRRGITGRPLVAPVAVGALAVAAALLRALTA